MDKIFVFILCFYFCSAKIKINRLDVPSAILYGSQNDVILDCDFDSGDEKVTEIKWFLDGDTQIYQWLPSTNTKARAIGKLKNHIDTNYKATNDEDTMYRALHITDLSPEFSGNYTCKVSGLMSEDVETKRMIIYVIPEDISSDDELDDPVLELTVSEKTSEISCNAGGFYPEPNMTIYIINENDTDIVFRQDDEKIILNEEGYYNVSSVLQYQVVNLTQNFNYICELNLPGTPYNISEKWTHFQDDSSETQVEEDLINTTNSSESWFGGSTEVETQIEEESNFTTITTETSTNADDGVKIEETNISRHESSSLRHLPSLLTTMLMLALLGPLFL